MLRRRTHRSSVAAAAALATCLGGLALAPAHAKATRVAGSTTRPRPRPASAAGERSAPSTRRPAGSDATCSAAAATRSTRASRRRPRSASPSRTAPASAAAATSSTTTRRPARCSTIDGRETAPRVDAARRVHRPGQPGKPYNFTPELVTSGVSVGVPGTPATWDAGAATAGARCSLGQALRAGHPAGRRAASSSTSTFRQQTLDNEERFKAFTRPRGCSCPAATRPRSARSSATPTSRATYRLLGRSRASRALLPRPARRRDRADRAAPAEDGPTPTCRCRPAIMRASPTCAAYRAIEPTPDPRRLPRARRLRHGARPRSGGSTVGEALNILEQLRPGRR